MGTSFGTFHLPASFHNNGVRRPFVAGEVPPTLTRYASSDMAARYFCSTCGTHIYMHFGGEDALNPSEGDRDEWWVCTGAVDGDARHSDGLFKTEAQIWADGTGDGGLAYLVGHSTPTPVEEVSAYETGSTSSKSPIIPRTTLQERLRRYHPLSSEDPRDETLIAQCHCHSTTIFLSRPDIPSSYPPTSRDGPGWHECLDRPEGSDDAWWLRSSLTDRSKRDRLATIPCACVDCRKSVGSEIVSWTYTPTGCISLALCPDGSSATDPTTKSEAKVVPWSAIAPYIRASPPISATTTVSDSLPGHLKGYKLPFRIYESSEGVHRGFCGTCGATIFWYGPQGGTLDNMIDLSAALFSESAALGSLLAQVIRSDKDGEQGGKGREVGSRRDDWLDWTADRVTSSDNAEGRGDLVERLGEGLKSKEWKEALSL